MPVTLVRVIKAFAAAALVGFGAVVVFAAVTRPQTLLSAWAFGLGVSVILAAIPIMPWLLVLPALTHRRYWGAINRPPEE